MYSLAFVCLFVNEQNYAKTTQVISTKFSGNVAHRPNKKWLHSGDNMDQFMLGSCKTMHKMQQIFTKFGGKVAHGP